MQVSALRGVTSASGSSRDLSTVAHLWHMRIEQGGHRVEVVTEQSGVDVERRSRRGVPDHPLHGLDVRPSGDGQGRGRVAQVVRSQPDDAG